MRKYLIKNRFREAKAFQFYMHQFVEAAIEYGVPAIGGRRNNQKDPLPIIKKALVFFHKRFAPTIKLSKKRIIITSSGPLLLHDAWPYYHCEIIPMLWDCWPGSFDRLIMTLKILRVKEAFFTQSEVANKVKEKIGIITHWVPEGIDISDYQKGDVLSNRKITLYEFGRQHPQYHKIIMSLVRDGTVSSYRSNTYDSNGALLKLAFSTAQELIDALPHIQIAVSFPKSLTHPESSGGIETLTQRYWESMLTGTLIVGHCPDELLKVIGYNPVVEVDWKDPGNQLREIIANIDTYQELVDRNYQAALSHASWLKRIEFIDSILMRSNICQ